MSTSNSTTHIVVCTTCRVQGTSREEPADGLGLLDAVQTALWTAEGEHNAPLNIRLQGQACMSGCNRACTLAIQAAGKWSYYWGDLTPDAETATQVVASALMHQCKLDGELPWGSRPERLKIGVLARLPPSVVLATAGAQEA